MGEKMTRIFHCGEETKVFVDEEFDIRIDDAPQETYARLNEGGRLVTIDSNGIRREGGVAFFHFKAIAPGVQKVEFPPTMLAQNVEIQNSIGVPILELFGETTGTDQILEGNPLPLADTA